MESMNCFCGHCGCHPSPVVMTLIVLAIVFDLVLRGMAMWRAAKNGQKGWFIALLVINTVGILPLIYMFVINKKKES